jgi:hypothetical protein
MENKTNLSANSTLPAVFIFDFGAYPLYNQEGLAKIPFKAVMGFTYK